MKQTGKNKASGRIVFVGLLFAAGFMIIAGRLVELHVLDKSFLSKKAKSQYSQSVETQPKRGVIYDAQYRELGVNLDVAKVAVRPGLIKDAKAAGKILASYLDRSAAEFQKELENKDRAYIYVDKRVSTATAQAVKKEWDAAKASFEYNGPGRNPNIPSLELEEDASRFYPNLGLGAQVLGFCGAEGHGLEGLEYKYDDLLTGKGSKWTILKDAMGRSFARERQTYSKKTGDNLVLTLDRTVQYIAEEALAEAVEKFQAKSGIAVVMVPDTGAILAMANAPLYNPNAISEYSFSDWRNRAVTDTFEPGSTLKIFMAAAAVESGKCGPNSIFYCEQGNYKIGPNVVHDTHPHSWLSLQQIVKVSSNIGAVKVGEKIGPDFLFRTLDAFGFGKKLGVDCPGEASGMLRPHNQWTAIDAGTIAFGQGVSVTGLQLASAVSAIANGGVLMRPRLVQAITNSKGRLVESFQPEPLERAVSEETAQVVARIMKTVTTEGGTGTQAALDGYRVCGKTGTAQKPAAKGGYEDNKYIASFVGFAPLSNPAVTVVVVIDEPTTDHYGGVVAAPAFREIMQKTLHYLKVAPEVDTTHLTASLKRKNGPA
ncbi:Peptidoglycan glycosyltransferase [Desulfatibacillum aliphaticivorans]|uniref:Peptidoglycan glycosyltransferase n=1 Tax=Desulfatibacillum aliphaticivorans TaxID=218208 RepID=B8FBS4_DESAL|nr:penicillin-binding protein 2 [Desulfatibacillum aliphaticivorans]ACL04827.1 Peptidoglycan glycosyltransferase [Desulfatibacillum aliphaticivorans]